MTLGASDRMSDGEGVSEAFRSEHKRSLRYNDHAEQRRINALQHCTEKFDVIELFAALGQKLDLNLDDEASEAHFLASSRP